jgi:perosamine synthetase
MSFIPYAGPWITDREVALVAEAAAHGWYERAGEFPHRFEGAFAEKVGRRFAVSVPHCTAAIHLALLALGVGPGDEVIVPDITWIATAAPVSYVGATPVFADVDAGDWCLSTAAFEACITPRTKAVIPVDLYGNVPDFDGIVALAKARGIGVVEDAAQAIGSVRNGRPAGSFGDMSVFSLHGSKTVTTGEGGMLVLDDAAMLDRILVLRDHGRPPGDRSFFNSQVAYKYKMSALQAALGIGQLERIDELVGRKREIFAWYRSALADERRVSLNQDVAGVESSYWLTTAVIDRTLGLTKGDVVRELARHDIDSRPMFHPLSSLPAYASHPQAAVARERNEVARALAPLGVNLPSALRLDRTDVERVARTLIEILDGSS